MQYFNCVGDEPEKVSQSKKDGEPQNQRRPSRPTSSTSQASTRSQAEKPVPAPRKSISEGSKKKLKLAAQVAKTGTNWPGQTNSRACIIL